MSEELLKALMELFAVLAKQEANVDLKQIQFIKNFLNQQLSDDQFHYYYQFFIVKLGKTDKNRAYSDIEEICDHLNEKLVQSQKIVVLLRLFEFINVVKTNSYAQLDILNKISDFFNVPADEYYSLNCFVNKVGIEKYNDANLLFISGHKVEESVFKHIQIEVSDVTIYILRIPSVSLYLLKYVGQDTVHLNGSEISNWRIYIFAPGSAIRLSKGKPVCFSDIASQFMRDVHETKLSFEVANLEYRFPNKVIGVKDVTLAETQGKLVGIMGASGAGKSTLLSVMCGLEEPSAGTIHINGINFFEHKEELISAIGLVPQDDLLIEELTVFENLYYNAKLCFREKNEEQLTTLVENTLTSLGLLEKKDLKVGSPFVNKTISGGERKRLNIALELIREPLILFVDEPTSGLSSSDSENVMDLLRELSLRGKLVFVVIHQPSSDIYKMFDKIVVLDTGGYMIYYGNPVEAVMYFKRINSQINSNVGECPTCGNVNPELILNIIDERVVDEFGKYTQNRKVPPAKWEEHYQTYIIPDEVTTVKEPLPKILNVPNWFNQAIVYLQRDFFAKISNRQYILLNMMEAPILGFILSYIIRYIVDPHSKVYVFRENENIPIFIFMSLIVALFLGLTVSAEEIFRDRKILRREAFLNLHRSSYLVSKITILFIISAIQTILFVLIANYILGIQNMTFYYWFALFTTAACANMIGLNISATFNSAVNIYIVIPLVMIPMMVLSGAMFSFEKLNRSISTVGKTPIIADIMPTKWSYEALMVHQFKDNRYEELLYHFEKEESQSDFVQVYYLPELDKKLENCNVEYSKKGKIDQTSGDLEVLKNELSWQTEIVYSIPFDAWRLVSASFNEPLYLKTKNYLKKLSNYYNYKFMLIYKQKEQSIEKWEKRDRQGFNRMKDEYYNESVADIVKKAFEKNKLIEYDGYLYQNIDPIYLEPRPEHFLHFRSHFMAPVKYFAGMWFDTYWFNMLVIWLYSMILFVCLYYELFKKTLGWIVKFRLKR